MKLNLKKFLYSKKFLDVFSFVVCVLYLFFVVSFIICDFIMLNNYEIKFEKLIAYADSVNQQVLENNFYNPSKEEVIIPTEPLFADGKTALISAYNKSMGSNSFYAEIKGTMTTNAIGINVKVSCYNEVVKYSNQKVYEYGANKLIETNASTLFDYIDKTSSQCSKLLKENNNINIYRTNKVRFQNNIPVADFSDSVLETSQDIVLLVDNIYIINENTIEKITYFKIKYDQNGKPVNYYVQAELNPQLSTVNYKNILEKGAGSLKPPVFSKCLMTAVINAQGYATSISTMENCTIVMDIMGGVSCPCNLSQTYVLSGFDEKMTFVPEGF